MIAELEEVARMLKIVPVAEEAAEQIITLLPQRWVSLPTVNWIRHCLPHFPWECFLQTCDTGGVNSQVWTQTSRPTGELLMLALTWSFPPWSDRDRECWGRFLSALGSNKHPITAWWLLSVSGPSLVQKVDLLLCSIIDQDTLGQDFFCRWQCLLLNRAVVAGAVVA